MMCELFTENFAGQIYEWCDEHDCKLTGHAIEESSLFGQMIACAGIMPFYEYEHILGMDWLGRDISTEMAPRQVYSAATQLGKKHVLTETFACAGWDVTPKELKRIAEWQYVNGVNLMCQHLYPYSIRGQRKRDYPAFYSEHNPWTTEFKHFNDYFTRLGYIDNQHLAHRIRAEVMMATGLLDNICPPSSQFAAYNKITSKKQVVIYPDYKHEGYPLWDEKVMQFMLGM